MRVLHLSITSPYFSLLYEGPLFKKRTANDVDVSPDNVLKHLKKLQSEMSETPDGLPSFFFELGLLHPIAYPGRGGAKGANAPPKIFVLTLVGKLARERAFSKLMLEL